MFAVWRATPFAEAGDGKKYDVDRNVWPIWESYRVKTLRNAWRWSHLGNAQSVTRCYLSMRKPSRFLVHSVGWWNVCAVGGWGWRSAKVVVGGFLQREGKVWLHVQWFAFSNYFIRILSCKLKGIYPLDAHTCIPLMLIGVAAGKDSSVYLCVVHEPSFAKNKEIGTLQRRVS